MPILLDCDCGRSLRVKDELAGRKIRCTDCRGVLTVPQPQVEKEEDEVLDVLPADPPARRRSSRSESNQGATAVAEKPRRPSLAPQKFRAPELEDKPARSSKPRTASRARKRDRSGSGIVVGPQIITGLLMMVGAAVWFFVGLAGGIIFFYPPVLFVLGIGTIIRGFTGGS